MTLLFFQHTTAFLMFVELLRKMFPNVFWPLNALTPVDKPIFWLALAAIISATSIPNLNKWFFAFFCGIFVSIQTLLAPSIPLWLLSLSLSLTMFSYVIQSSVAAAKPRTFKFLCAVNFLFLFLLYANVIYNTIARAHLGLGHIIYVFHMLFENPEYILALKDLGGNPSLIIRPTIFNIAIYIFTTAILGAYGRPARPLCQKSDLQATAVLFLLQVLLYTVLFHLTIERRPFYEYLTFRFTNAAMPIPLPKRFNDPSFRNAVFAPDRLDIRKTMRQGIYTWQNQPKYNLVILLIESWRSDALFDMPRLNALLKGGISLKNHFSTSNSSIGGGIGLHYGIYPIDIFGLSWKKPNLKSGSGDDSNRVQQNFDGTDVSSFIEFMKRGGYQCNLGNITDYIPTKRYTGLWQKDFPNESCDAASLTLHLMLQTLKKPGLHFLETQLFATHFNYSYPPEFEIHKPIVSPDIDFIKIGFTAQTALGLANRYKNACLFLDYLISDFLENLKSEGLNKSTVVVLVGDHGECLGEDDNLFHANGPHKNQAQTNLIIFAPNIEPRIIEEFTSHVDLIPTLGPILGYTASDTIGRNALTLKRNEIVNIDISSWGRIIMRRKDHMTLFRLTNSNTLEWEITARNDNAIDDGIYALYNVENLKSTAELIRRDRADAIKLLEGGQ